jgi:hypothetical protein
MGGCWAIAGMLAKDNRVTNKARLGQYLFIVSDLVD